MKLKHILVIGVIGFILALPGTTQAILIVDTGEPTTDLPAAILGDFSWLAGKFTLDQSYTLNNAQGRMLQRGGSATLVIYGNGGQIPNTGDELFDATFVVDPFVFPIEFIGLALRA